MYDWNNSTMDLALTGNHQCLCSDVSHGNSFMEYIFLNDLGSQKYKNS